MSYRIRLFLTHIATALVAGYCVWCGQQVEGFSKLAFMVLFAASIIVPNTIAARWLTGGLKKLESSLGQSSSTLESSGLKELDDVTVRLRKTLEHQRALAQNVDDLVIRLGHASVGSKDGTAKKRSQLLTDALGQLSRLSARDAGTIMSLSEDMAKGAHDAHGGAQEQIRAVAQTTPSVEALSGRIVASGNDAAAVHRVVEEIHERTVHGLGLIQQLVQGMEGIQSNVEYCEQKVMTLGQQSERIGSIVETMGDISARTDMLALNASIEAVRAGQEGRGFTVVADEVRKLAESTATASREIAELVNAIQSEATDAVSVISEERQQVQDEIDRVHQAASALEEIGRHSVTVGKQSEQISKSSTEQLQKTQEIVRAMQQLSTIASRIDERSESIRHKATDLSETAQDLEDRLSPMYHYGESDGHASRGRNSHAASPKRQAAQSVNELLEAASAGEFRE